MKHMARFFGFGVLILSLGAFAQSSAATGSKLQEQMKALGALMQQLQGQIRDVNQNCSSFKVVVHMQDTAALAEQEVPPKANTIPPDQREAFLKDFKDTFANLQTALTDVRAQLEIDKNEEAAAALAKVVDIMRAAHKKFR